MRDLSKKTKVVVGVVITLSILAISVVAVAQNHNANPRYGQVSLQAGFMPDPHVRNLTAGGSINTSHCPGPSYVANEPDYRLNWGGGNLNIYAISSSDTTLVINKADGSWECNDDGGSGLNPLITISQAGRYDIYVGTYSSTPVPAVLKISEMTPQW